MAVDVRPRRGAGRRRKDGTNPTKSPTPPEQLPRPTSTGIRRRPSGSTLRPAFRTAPASGPAPDRRDPQSQSFSRSYGSSLPTSLTYIAPSTRGCAPRRPAAEIRYGPARRSSSPSLGFSRAAAARRTPRRQRPCGALFATSSLARGDGLSGSSRLRQKRQLFPAAAATSPSLFGSPRRSSGEGLFRAAPATGCRNLHRLPFRPSRRGQATDFPSADRNCLRA